MAPKEGGGILATVIRRFQAGELDISVESALNKVPYFTGNYFKLVKISLLGIISEFQKKPFLNSSIKVKICRCGKRNMFTFVEEFKKRFFRNSFRIRKILYWELFQRIWHLLKVNVASALSPFAFADIHAGAAK